MKRPKPQTPGLLAALVFSAGILGAVYSGALTAAGQNESAASPNSLEVATFAGGCFWCVESDFDSVPGVVRTVSGYTGGDVKNPTYRQVSSDTTGHREAVQIYYDPGRVSYAALLEIFWRSVDPTDADGQFCDRGENYTTAIFTNSDNQLELAKATKRMLEASGILHRPVVTIIEPADTFYPSRTITRTTTRKTRCATSFIDFPAGATSG